MRADTFSRESYRLLLAGVLGTWLGIQAVRGTFNLVVWNVAEGLPPNLVAAVGAAIWTVGILGWIPARIIGPARAGLVFALMLAAASVLRSAVGDGLATPYLTFLAFVAWAWWMPCWLRNSGADPRVVAAAIVLGVTVQQSAHIALHGLDLQVMVGVGPAIAALALSLAFVWAVLGDRADQQRTTTIAWGALAFGPFLFLQLSLLANPGRIAVVSGYELPYVAIFPVLGLIGGLVFAAHMQARWQRAAVAGLLVALLAGLERAGAATPIVIVGAQAGAALLMISALSSSAAPGARRIHLMFAAGQVLFFVFIFLFYSRVEWPLIWLVAAVVLGLASQIPQAGPTASPRLLPLAGGVAAVAGVLIALIPAGGRPAGQPPPRLAVLTYNIHQGIDVDGVPAVGRIARVIEDSDADIVMLQEANRGLTISGGADYVAWLSWRLPGYRAVFGPMHSLFGNAILTRYPVTRSGWELFPQRVPGQLRGFTWAVLRVGESELLVIAAHLPRGAHAGRPAIRAEQVSYLLQFIDGRASVVAGVDLNDVPGSLALLRATSGGLNDAAAVLEQGDALTYPAAAPYERIDYVLYGDDLRAVEHAVAPATASDHRPVLVRLEWRR